MNLSGILVTTAPARMTQVCNSLNAIAGVEVFHTDADKGRIIAVQEAETVHDEVAGLKRIKKLPHIILAEMVHHYIGESNDAVSMQDIPDDLDKLTGLPSAVPAYLNE